MSRRRKEVKGPPKLYEFALGLVIEVARGTGAIETVFRHIPGVTTAASLTTSETLTLPRSVQQLYDSCVRFSFPDLEQLQARFACESSSSSSSSSSAETSDGPTDHTAFLQTERFGFVLTDEYGTRYFGYALRYYEPPALDQPKAFVVCSRFPIFSLWSHLVKELVELNSPSSPAGFQRCGAFLDRVAACPVPSTPGESFKVPCFASALVSRWPFVLPDVNDSPLNYTDFQPLLRYLQPKLLLALFASVLFERRFVFIAPQISTLCAVVQAFVALLFPLQWHHTYIPLLPRRMIDICSAPVPFIVGMQAATWRHVRQSELEADVVIVDIDGGHLLSPANNDVACLPTALTTPLLSLLQSLTPTTTGRHSSLKSLKLKKKKRVVAEELVDLIPPKAQVDQLVGGLMDFYNQLLLGYRNHYQPAATSYDFDKDGFIMSAHPTYKPFLEQFVQTQLFEQFIADRAAKYAPPAPVSSLSTTTTTSSSSDSPNESSSAFASRFSIFQSAQEIEEVRRLIGQGAQLKTLHQRHPAVDTPQLTSSAPTILTGSLSKSSPALTASPSPSSMSPVTAAAKPTGISWGKLVSMFSATHPSIELVVGLSTYSVGRSEHCLVCISHSEVSSEHCKFVLERDSGKQQSTFSLNKSKAKRSTAEAFFCYDHSTNGTFVNGRLIGKGKRVRLTSGDFISLSYSHDAAEAMAGFQYIFGAVNEPTPSAHSLLVSSAPAISTTSSPSSSGQHSKPHTAPAVVHTPPEEPGQSAAKANTIASPPQTTTRSFVLPHAASLQGTVRRRPAALLKLINEESDATTSPPPLATRSPAASPPQMLPRPEPVTSGPPARPPLLARPQLTRTQSEWLPRLAESPDTPLLSPSSPVLVNLNPRMSRTTAAFPRGPPSIRAPPLSQSTSAAASTASKSASSPAPSAPSSASVRPSSPTKPSRKCRPCGRESPSTARFCMHCGGTELNDPSGETIACPKCAASSPAGKKFCSQCGHALQTAAPPIKGPQTSPTCQRCQLRPTQWHCSPCNTTSCESCFQATHRFGRLVDHHSLRRQV